MSVDLVWKNPPAREPRKVDLVAAQLRARPGEWARIDSGPIRLFPWWAPLYNSDEFEVRFVRHNPNELFGPSDVYVRAVGQKS